MSQHTINEDVLVNGVINCAQVVPSQACIGNAAVVSPSAPALAIEHTKLRHQHRHTRALFDFTATPAAKRQALCVVRGTAGSVVRFEACVPAAVTAGSITADLLKNGASILSATITLNNTVGTGGTAFDKVAAAGYTSTVLAAGDVLEVNVTVSGLTGGGGLFVQLTTAEDPS